MSCLHYARVGEGWILTDTITLEKYETEGLILDVCEDEDFALLV